MGTETPSAAVTYSSYLRLAELLDQQRPRTGSDATLPEHDELLFITIHQVYELWFKQLLHELRGDQAAPGEGGVQGALEKGDAYAALALLGRVLKILKTLVAQIDVLETMTPLQFAAFRSRLDSASGFQSGQFREIEAVLGRHDPKTIPRATGDDPVWARVHAAVARRSLWASYLTFLHGRGHDVPAAARASEPALPTAPSPEVQRTLVRVYREDEAAALVSERMVDLDEGLQEWRYRHVKMVERTIGSKPGTGGSLGAAYLAGTLFQPVFPDLWAVRAEL